VASVVTVEYTPNGVGSQATQDCLVQGIRHDIAPDSHRVTLSLVQALPRGESLWNAVTWGPSATEGTWA
jgi:hypothetical protein